MQINPVLYVTDMATASLRLVTGTHGTIHFLESLAKRHDTFGVRMNGDTDSQAVPTLMEAQSTIEDLDALISEPALRNSQPQERQRRQHKWPRGNCFQQNEGFYSDDQYRV